MSQGVQGFTKGGTCVDKLNLDLFFRISKHDPAYRRLSFVGEDRHAQQLALKLGKYCEERGLTHQTAHDILSCVGMFLDVAYPYGCSGLSLHPNEIFEDEPTPVCTDLEAKP